MPAKYQIFKDVKGNFRFRLRAENNKIIAVSQAYEQHANSIKGLKSVQKNCNSEIEDMTIEGACAVVPNPKYQVFHDEKFKFRFYLNASNGEIIAASEGYENKEGCLNGIQAVKNSCNAEIEDLTFTKEGMSSPVEMVVPEFEKKDGIVEVAVVEKEASKAPMPVPIEAIATEAKSEDLAPPSMPVPKTAHVEMANKSRVVFVGNKMPMDYVMAIITGLSDSNLKEITLKARGRAITTAVDATEITRNRFLKNLKVSKIAIGTEEMPAREGETRARMVSTIEIVLTKM